MYIISLFLSSPWLVLRDIFFNMACGSSGFVHFVSVVIEISILQPCEDVHRCSVVKTLALYTFFRLKAHFHLCRRQNRGVASS